MTSSIKAVFFFLVPLLFWIILPKDEIAVLSISCEFLRGENHKIPPWLLGVTLKAIYLCFQIWSSIDSTKCTFLGKYYFDIINLGLWKVVFRIYIFSNWHIRILHHGWIDDGSVVKSTCCPSKGPDSSVQFQQVSCNYFCP